MSTFTNTTKNASSLSNLSKNSFTPSNTGKSLVATVATAGEAMGLLLALAYSGGQVLAQSAPIFTNVTKN